MLGDNLRAERTRRRMSVETLADLCGLSEATLRRVECGKRDLTITEATTIALALGVDLHALLPQPAAA